MSNIAVTHVRIFGGHSLSHVEILAILLEGAGGKTYVEPLRLEYTEGGRCLDISYGAKGTPSPGPENLWARRDEGSFAAIWVRFDTGNDDPRIYSVDERGDSERRDCPYEKGRSQSWDTCLDEDYRKSIVDFIKGRTKPREP